MEGLILIDIQRDYFPGGKFPLKGMVRVAKEAKKILEYFRGKGLFVVHMQHINLHHKKFFLPESQGAEIHPWVQPKQKELHLIKHRPDSFSHPQLDEMLRKKGIQKIHIAGAMTNMCVDTTVRSAFEKGYKVILYPKACSAPGLLGTPLIHHLYVKNLLSVFAKEGSVPKS